MKITIESTTKIVELNGVPCRVWEGESEGGVKVHAFIARVAADPFADVEQFERELVECAPPSSGVEGIPLRLII